VYFVLVVWGKSTEQKSSRGNINDMGGAGKYGDRSKGVRIDSTFVGEGPEAGRRKVYGEKPVAIRFVPSRGLSEKELDLLYKRNGENEGGGD